MLQMHVHTCTLYVHVCFVWMHVHTCSSCMTRIGMHELHGRMHPNTTILLAIAVPTNPNHPMTSSTTSASRYEPIKTLVAKQQPTNVRTILENWLQYSSSLCSVNTQTWLWALCNTIQVLICLYNRYSLLRTQLHYINQCKVLGTPSGSPTNTSHLPNNIHVHVHAHCIFLQSSKGSQHIVVYVTSYLQVPETCCWSTNMHM